MTTECVPIRKLYPAEYNSWATMRRRCNDSKFHKYKYYGAKGVTVCDRWDSFDTFLSDMGVRPKGTTLDRFPDKDGNYKPGNCRWATHAQQNRNRRNCVNLTSGGITQTLNEWAKQTGQHQSTLRARWLHGWSDAEIIGGKEINGKSH